MGLETRVVCECCHMAAQNGGADGLACGPTWCAQEHRFGTVGNVPLGYVYDDSRDFVVPMHHVCTYDCDSCGDVQLDMAPMFTYMQVA